MNGPLSAQIVCWPAVNVQFTASRRRFEAMSNGFHQHVRAARMAMLGALFDELPPTWLVSRDRRVLDANAPAEALAATGGPVAVIDGHLCPSIAEGKRRLAAALAELKDEARFSWPCAGVGGETSLRLRAVPGGDAVTATLLHAPDPVADVAPRLASQFGIPHRQSQLAAHLLAGHSLSAAAHAMEISRATASEHLASLQKRLGQPSRQALLAHLLTGYR
jgi:DNA-binding CsgD family transcriptional regulator